MSIDRFDRFDVSPRDPWQIIRGTAPETSDPTSFVKVTRGEPNRLGFPERISLDAEVIRGTLENLQFAPDTVLGAAKFLPGVRGVGDLLGQIGRPLEQVPVLPQVGQFVSDTARETVAGIFGRAGTVLGEIGRTFDTEDETPIPLKVLNAPMRIGASALLGETGSKLISGRGDLTWDDATKDVLDTFAVASVIPALKVAGLIGKAATGGNTAAQVARGFVTPFQMSLAPSVAENYARLAGRVVTGAYGGGFAMRAVLPHVAGNEWWAKEILANRYLPEDNAWRFPMDLALSLPLDLVSLTRLTASSRQAAWTSRKVFGTAPPPLLLKLPDAENSIGTTISNNNWGWVNTKLIEDAASNRLIDSLNTSVPEGQRVQHGQWQKAAEMRGESSQEFRNSMAEEIGRMFSSLGTRGAHELAARELDRWASTPGLTPGGLLQLADEYATWARRIEPANPGKVLAVEDFAKARHAPLAVNYLDSISEWGPKQHAAFKIKFPALAPSLDGSFLTNKQEWLNQVKSQIDPDNRSVSAPRDGYVRLYRVEDPATGHASEGLVQDARKTFQNLGYDGPRGRFFSSDPLDVGSRYRTVFNKDKVEWSYIDIPTADFEKWRAARLGFTEADVLVPTDFYAQRTRLTATEAEGMLAASRAPVITPPAKMGSLMAQLDDLDDRIYRGEKLGEARKKVSSEIAALREEVADGYKKQLQTLHAARDARVSDLNSDLNDIERQAVLEDIRRMNDAISKANEDYYNLGLLAGSRWRLHTPPSGGPVMRVSDEPIYKGLDLKARRTNMGKVYDALFGAVRNADMGREAMQKMMDAGASAGVSAREMKEFMELLAADIRKGTFGIGSAASFRIFASVWHLPSFWINNVARGFERANGSIGLPTPKSYKSWSEAVYRNYPGPFAIFARQLGKELPEIPYNEALHTITRALYGTFRFTLDPRFLLLNFGEPHIIRQALARTGEVDEATITRLIRQIERIQEEVRDTGALDLSGKSRSIALYAWSRRPDEFTRTYLPIIKRQDEMKKVLASYGVKTDAEFVQFLDDTIRERVRLLEETEAITTAEGKLKTELDAAKKELKTVAGDGDRSLKTADVERLEEELALSRRQREVLDLAKKEGWHPELQSALDVLMRVDQNVTRDAIRAFRGNPDRTAAERLLNSYLLYWPISYQVKAGKLLFEFMFSKGLGLRTGSAGAQAWLKVRRDHERKLREDPEYAAFFDDNDDLLFLLQMLIPLTPEDVGVSLSPFTRIPLKIGRGETPARIVERTFNQGPVYTFGDLLPKLMAEQTKPGGLLHDLLDYSEGD